VSEHREWIFVGCYTGESGGEGEGIAMLRRDPASGSLDRVGVAARTPSPSFLAQHPTRSVLYAANELTEGTVSAFAVAPDATLTLLATRATGGEHPCHLAVTADGRFLLTANYSSGSVSVHPLDADGVIGERTDLLGLQGSGPVADRQAGPHAHMVLPDPFGPDVLISDLGSDTVWRTRLDPVAGRLALPVPAIEAAAGTGPRHLRRTGDGTFLVSGELSATLNWYRPGAGGALEAGGAVPASTIDGANLPSELVIGADGRFVYLANRGPNTVSAYAWDGAGAELIAEVPTGGDWPRHLALLSDHLYVANERSHTVTTFRIDPDTGLPGMQGDPLGAPSPTCIVRWNPGKS